MTLTATPPIKDYVEDALTIAHSIPFEFNDATDIVCTRIPVGGLESAPLIRGTDYAVSGGNGSMGTVTKAGPGTAGATFRIRRQTLESQTTEFSNSTAFPAANAEKALDRAMAVAQELDQSRQLLEARTLRTQSGETMDALPAESARKGTLLGFNVLTGLRELLSYSSVAALIAPLLPSLIGGILKGDPGGNAAAIGLFTAASGFLIPDGFDMVETAGYSVLGIGAASYAYDATLTSAYVTANPRTSFITTNGRVYKLASAVISPTMFGAIGDLATDDLAALQACSDFFFASIRSEMTLDLTGQYGIGGTFNLGPSTASSSEQRYNVRGNLFIKQLTPGTFQTLIIEPGLTLTTWHGSLAIEGAEGLQSAWASRTCGIGVTFLGAAVSRITGHVRAYGFWYVGAYFPSALDPGATSNDELVLGTLDMAYCSSGCSVSGQSLTANWSAPVRTGTSKLGTQFDTIAVTALPPAAIETFRAVGDQAIYVNINGNWHFVTAWDRVANTISIFPWLDAASYDGGAGSGTLRYAFGGGVMASSVDSFIQAEHIHILNCGIAVNDANLYGLSSSQSNISNNGIGLSLGAAPGAAHIGSNYKGFYLEANDADIILLSQNGASYSNFIETDYNTTVSKVLAIGARDTASDQTLGTFGFRNTSSGVGDILAITEHGHRHYFQDQPLWNDNFDVVSFTDHNGPNRLFSQNVDTQTVNLTVVDQSYNRLFGYKGALWRYTGSGPNGAPTGPITFTPTSAPYASCVTTNASAVVTMPSTAGLIAGMPIAGAGIPANATIVSVDSPTQIHLSANATASATVTLTVTGSVNGAFANAVFTGFMGAALFDIAFTDQSQLQWTINCITGQPGAPRVQRLISSATVTPTVNNDQVHITAQSGPLTLANPTGTPFPGQRLIIRVKDDGASHAISYGAQYRAFGIALPTATVLGKVTYLTCFFNATETTWDVTSVATQV